MRERISGLEDELRKHNIAKKELCSLESLCASINNRVAALGDLKAEIEDISRSLYYYDMIDRLGGVSAGALTLRQTAHLAKELELARRRFVEDSDSQYLAVCARIQRRTTAVGLERLDAAFRSGEYAAEDVALFLAGCGADARCKAERSYFRSRKKNARSKVLECIADLRKNYKLAILGEMQGYSRLFCSGDVLGKYERMGFPKKADDLNDLETFVYELFAEVFRRVGYEGAKRVCLDVGRDGENVLNEIFLSLLCIHFGPGIRDGDVRGVEI